MNLEETKYQRSKEKYEVIFQNIKEDNSLIDIVYSNLERFDREKKLHPIYIKMWYELMSNNLNTIKEKILQKNDEGILLRSTTPFIGIIDNNNKLIRKNEFK